MLATFTSAVAALPRLKFRTKKPVLTQVMLLKSILHSGRAQSIALLGAIFFITQAHAQPTIVSVVPASGATGVSTSAQVVFTFSGEMDTNFTTATFYNETNFTAVSTESTWSVGNTVLTCTPTPSWPSGTILWEVDGQDTNGDSLAGVPVGTFTVGSGGGGTPCSGVAAHTNTSFTLDESWLYVQTSAATPVLNPETPYSVLAEVSLISNLTASAAGLVLASGGVSNLNSDFVDPGTFIGDYLETNLTTLNSTWPNGTYTFDLTNPSPSFPSVPVTWNLAQPNVPTIANWAATQAVDSTKAFTLTWNSFSNRIANTNEIGVNIGYDPCAGTGFTSNLPGNATSVTIPANVLSPGSNYANSILVFINVKGATNTSPKYTSGAVRGTETSFTLITIGGGGGGTGASLGASSLSKSNFTFSISGTAGKKLTVQYSATLLPGSWSTLEIVTNVTGTLSITNSEPAGTKSRFYRVYQ
jgi:methionine-rich copper-binding protein CopC